MAFDTEFKTSFSGEEKMKKFLLGTVALVAVGATVPSLAADLPARTYTKAPADAPAPIYNCTGFHMGGRTAAAFNATHRRRGRSSRRANHPLRCAGAPVSRYTFAP